MPRPKKGSICKVWDAGGQGADAETKTVVCTNVGKAFFSSLDTPDSKIVQRPISVISCILEDEEAMAAYREWKTPK